MEEVLSKINSWVWGSPLVILLIGVGLYFTIRLGFVQIRLFPHAIAVLSGKYDREGDPGEISHFKALMTALSGTIGTGNIIGVAVAISMGGAGAVFWMWVTAIVGMATKFASCSLAVAFRKVGENGEACGGPMYYIELGIGKKFKWLAVLFAIFTVIASFGIGNMFQVKSLTIASHVIIFGKGALTKEYFDLILGIILAVIVALVILGGIRRISSFAGFFIPIMFMLYILSGLIILFIHKEEIVPVFKTIFYSAFHAPEAISGGLFGSVIRLGVTRGIFSNESGLGSAPIAHGAAKTKEPIREGLVAMLGPFIDTILVCSMTAFVILTTGALGENIETGILTSIAFEAGLEGTGWIVSLSTIFFAFSTIVAWSYYGDRAIDYLFGNKSVLLYRIAYIIVVFIGALLPIKEVILISDIFNALMAIPNLLALLILSPKLSALTKEYLIKLKEAV